MTPNEIGALLAYADRLAPRYAPQDQTAAAERYRAFGELLADVPATAPHPDGHDWNAAHAVRRHLAESPYPLQASDITRPWLAFRSDLMGRHTGTFEPTAHPEIDPDDVHGYQAALRAERAAVAIGHAAPVAVRELSGGPSPATTRRLAALGEYMPRSVGAELAKYRPRRAAREALAAADLPDPLDVPCPYEPCRRPAGQPCRNRRGADRATPHPSRVDAATTRHHTREESA